MSQHLTLENSIFLPKVIALTQEGKLVKINGSGNSMRPFIEHHRDNLVFGKVDSISVGDVILAEVTPDHYVCHRIVKVENGIVTMRGDGNPVGTETFPIENVRAKLVKIERKGKIYDLRTSKVWKVYSAIWPKLLPIRRYLLALYRLLWRGEVPMRIKRLFK